MKTLNKEDADPRRDEALAPYDPILLPFKYVSLDGYQAVNPLFSFHAVCSHQGKPELAPKELGSICQLFSNKYELDDLYQSILHMLLLQRWPTSFVGLWIAAHSSYARRCFSGAFTTLASNHGPMTASTSPSRQISLGVN